MKRTGPDAASARRWGWLALVGLSAWSAGCRNSAPPVEEFLLAPLPDALAAPAAARAAAGPSVRVVPLRPRGFLDRREIGWREGAVRAGPYHYKRWGEAPAEAVTRQLVELLRARERFAAVDARAEAEGEMVVAGELLGLHEECAEDGSAPHGVAAIEYRMEWLDPVTGTRRESSPRLITRRVAVADASLAALAAAISTALHQVLEEIALQLEASAAQAAE
ncbi:MAG: hypothetical protein FJ293_07020 [Planctomycetes bacterium]|nr:hypothetical protein [Planctomycetota bacterium]